MAPDRTSIDLTNLRERIENARSDSAWKALSLSKKVRLLLEERLNEIERGASHQQASSQNRVQENEPGTLAWFIQKWDLDELSRRSGIPVETLTRYREGERPSDTDLVQMHNLFEDPDDGHLLSTEELMEIRRRTFNTTRRQTNGV